MSKNALLYVAVGVAYILGAASAILLVKDRIAKKERKRADEEIESVKEAFKRRTEKELQADEEPYAASDGLTMDDEYRQILSERRYVPDEPEDAVYIPPDEFGDNEDYEAYSVDYYEGDGVFADEAGEALEDEEWESLLGCGVVKHFGEYEEDRVCVRNDVRRAYYEVLRDKGKYRQ